MIYQFYIELDGSSPLVWRRIEVPANYTLYRLHMAFQAAFGWENSHLFEFFERSLPGAIRYGVPSAAGACPPEDVGGIHGYQAMLEVLQKPGSKEAKEYRQWLGLVEGEKWDAAFCSIREVNKRLCLSG